MNCISCKNITNDKLKCAECEKPVCRDCVTKCIGEEEEPCETRWCRVHAKRNADHCASDSCTRFTHTALCILHVRVCCSCDINYCDWDARDDWADCGKCFGLACEECYIQCTNYNTCGTARCAKCIGRKSGDDSAWMCKDCTRELKTESKVNK